MVSIAQRISAVNRNANPHGHGLGNIVSPRNQTAVSISSSSQQGNLTEPGEHSEPGEPERLPSGREDYRQLAVDTACYDQLWKRACTKILSPCGGYRGDKK